jgi:hypothetical protein
VDLEVSKSSLLCKWVVSAMEPGESTFDLCFNIDELGSTRKEGGVGG